MITDLGSMQSVNTRGIAAIYCRAINSRIKGLTLAAIRFMRKKINFREMRKVPFAQREQLMGKNRK